MDLRISVIFLDANNGRSLESCPITPSLSTRPQPRMTSDGADTTSDSLVLHSNSMDRGWIRIKNQATSVEPPVAPFDAKFQVAQGFFPSYRVPKPLSPIRALPLTPHYKLQMVINSTSVRGPTHLTPPTPPLSKSDVLSLHLNPTLTHAF